MATTTESQIQVSEPTSSVAAHSAARRRWSSAAMPILGLVGFGALAAFVYPKLTSQEADDSVVGPLTYKVTRSDLVITVNEDGNVESAANLDVKCKVSGGSTILWIVEDGTPVKAGDRIIELDQAKINDDLQAQKILYEKALATKIQTEQEYEAAEIAVREYDEGTYEKELQIVEANIKIALENLRSAENFLAHTEKMARKGFVTPLQLEADQFAVERTKLELKGAELARDVLVKFTREKTLKELVSVREASAAKARSEKAAFELEESRLKKLQEELANCIIVAPQGGMVIYANDMGRRRSSSAPQIEEGAIVREQQTLIRLPDLTKMQVRVTVHESKVREIEDRVEQAKIDNGNGLAAEIRIQGRTLTGSVFFVASQPEPGSWYSSEVKEYATLVKIDETVEDLKPGMSAEVKIIVSDLQDVLTVPVTAVVEIQGSFFCWAKAGQEWEKRPVILGQTNDELIEIKDGLLEDETVLLNPRATIPEARQDPTAMQGGKKKKESQQSNGAAKKQKSQTSTKKSK